MKWDASVSWCHMLVPDGTRLIQLNVFCNWCKDKFLLLLKTIMKVLLIVERILGRHLPFKYIRIPSLNWSVYHETWSRSRNNVEKCNRKLVCGNKNKKKTKQKCTNLRNMDKNTKPVVRYERKKEVYYAVHCRSNSDCI